jgi:signal transduction histidine kinase
MNKEKLKIRPYARLLTMLGEQLIKNERIALVELIKNAYDADASWVKVSFENFGDQFEVGPESAIIIEDDGFGMTWDVLTKHWLSPATPIKKLGKQKKDTTEKGRKIQGEKGIGRFAILKLGKKIEITTRPKAGREEFVVDFDLSRYDDDFLSEDSEDKDLFLDDLSIEVERRDPEVIVSYDMSLSGVRSKRARHGTKIEITGIKGTWNAGKVESVFNDLVRLQSNFGSGTLQQVTSDDEKRFDVFIFKDKEEQKYSDQYLENLRLLIDERAVFKIENGRYDDSRQRFEYQLNGVPYSLDLKKDLSGLRIFKKHFGDHGEKLEKFGTHCGSFNFGFYVFDFRPETQAPVKYFLKKNDRDIVRSHRIYLYRDGIRVYPYGDPEDDWLHIDQYRGTISAGAFLSNDQVVGFVQITQSENPELKDKTNREGLIDTGAPHDDFILLLQLFLAYIRSNPFAKYLSEKKKQNVIDDFKEQIVEKGLSDLANEVANNSAAKTILSRVEGAYKAERNYLVRRAETTEELAGVGLSVETASHDIMAVMGKAFLNLDFLIKRVCPGGHIDVEDLCKELNALRGMLSFVEAQLKDVQLLFKSSKQRRRNIRVLDVLEKVTKIFDSLLKKEGINLSIVEKGSPVVAKTTDAVLLQLFLNLFDNAVYWLQTVATERKKILVTLDGDEGVVIVSDNGPGIRPEDRPYIFEPFMSGKGEEGRGLGLYIARQLLERHEYAIELADIKSQKLLPGANFVISFVKGEE